MILADVHAHLDIDNYEQHGGVDKMLQECSANGVKAIVANGVDIASNRKVLEIAKKHPIVKVALGIYPTHCLEMVESGKTDFSTELKFIEDKIKHKECIAIGEVGLEYKEIKGMSEIQKHIQKDCLKEFVALAKKYNLPIILHSRGAELDTVELLEQEGMKNHKVIMHCFSGRKHIVSRIRDNGWSFSIPCNVDRSEHFQLIVKDTPISQLLTETDAPYMSPFPGKTNRPDNVKYTIKKIAQIKELTEEEAANIIYNNYQTMFL